MFHLKVIDANDLEFGINHLLPHHTVIYPVYDDKLHCCCNSINSPLNRNNYRLDKEHKPWAINMKMSFPWMWRGLKSQ